MSELASPPSEKLPPSAAALIHLAQRALDGGQVAHASVWLAAACRAEPTNADWWFDLASLRWQQRDLGGAIRAFQQAIAIRPNWEEACGRLAAVLDEQGDHAAAETWASKALMLTPRSAAAQVTLAQILRHRGELDSSIELLDAALRHNSGHATLHWNLAISLLLKEEYARGWDEYSWRKAAGEVVFDPYPFPRWQGEPLQRKSLLVHAEQGIGDEILFSTCFTDLLARGGSVTVICDPRLASLFSRSWPRVNFIGHARTKARTLSRLDRAFDYQVPAGELPRFFRRSEASFPRNSDLLKADSERARHWKSRYASLGQHLKIGISWQAGGQPRARAERSIALADFAPLLRVANVRWINLQYGETTDERNSLASRHGLVIHDWPEGDPLVDLDEHAAKISALDAVVTVGNATAHLAGALGLPTFVLLPHVPNWRWGMRSETSPWYGRVHLLRTGQNEDWQEVIARLFERLFGLRTDCPSSGEYHSDTKPAVQVSLGVVSDVRVAVSRAEQLVQLQQWNSAQSLLQSILAQSPRCTDAMQLWSRLAKQMGQIELSRALASRASAILASHTDSNYPAGV